MKDPFQNEEVEIGQLIMLGLAGVEADKVKGLLPWWRLLKTVSITNPTLKEDICPCHHLALEWHTLTHREFLFFVVLELELHLVGTSRSWWGQLRDASCRRHSRLWADGVGPGSGASPCLCQTRFHFLKLEQLFPLTSKVLFTGKLPYYIIILQLRFSVGV